MKYTVELTVNMTSISQKVKERMYANQLASILNKRWIFEFPPDELEWPDLIVFENSEKFGLEIREITNDSETRKGSKKREKESINNKIVQNLVEDYYKKSTTPIRVGILGDIDNRLDILQKLLEFSKKNEEWSSERIELNKGKTILYVSVLPNSIGKYTRWELVDDHVGWVREVESSFIRPYLIEKEKNIKKYKTHLNDVRLLLVADPTYSSGMLSFTDRHIFLETEFNEIYFLVYPNRVVRTNN